MHDRTDDTTADVSRRRLLGIAAGTAAAGLTAGCLGGVTGGGGGDDGMTEDGMDEGMDDDGTTEESMGDGESTDSGDGAMATTSFSVTVENVSETGTITTSDGTELPAVLSPGAYAVHDEMVTAFTPGEAASEELEALAEDGKPEPLSKTLEMEDGVASTGVFASPESVDGAAPLKPGQRYEFTVEAEPGQRLSLATMFVQSNDLFYAFDPQGIPLFDGERTMGGEMTGKLSLWDAGTEENEEPGAGPNQAPRQDGPDTGPDEDGVIRRLSEVDDGYDYPATDAVLSLTVTEN